MGSASRTVLVGTPLVAMATLAVGLRVGASDTTHAAMVRVAPHAHGESTYWWQVTTLVEDHGVREVEGRSDVTVHATARTAGGWHEATWKGDTNADGVAEARLDLPGVERGDPIDLDVRAAGSPDWLARGRVAWGDAAWTEVAPGPFVRSSKREGAIALDVAILGSRLVARAQTPLLVRATSREDGHALAGVEIDAEPEPGLDVSSKKATTCPNGWARIEASPLMWAASLSLHARLADGRAGAWFGELPVAPGAMDAHVPEIKAGEAAHLDVTAPSERTAYVEIDDDTGRAFATATPLKDTGTNATAGFEVPPLAPGLFWLVTSSEPRGAEKLAGAALARPLLVGGDGMPAGVPKPSDACAAGAYLALHPAGGFRRSVGLDGFVGREAGHAARKAKGRAIALSSLAIAGLIEGLLVLQASRQGRFGAGRARDGITVVVSILLALLGFGLLAALLLAHA